ncbi:1-deoxy-D-xylulose-5-phosphate reductoisomerase [Actimicrobium sp. GrIS 1.19]|uniref:1-deoxy-D-xylulose-5-phosphate reductoisomerase n=1 Tax=Actimicrobium sp. GrIS 1.19 TaxID=3071708 RepID=UPI002E12569A
MQTITILGSTGSIGISTLDVVAQHPDRYRVYALTAHSKVAELAAQCVQFRPEVAVVGSAAAAQALSILLKEQGVATEVSYGEAALCAVARAYGCDMVMAAIVGAAGLAPTLAAAQAGKKILLANKEALVMSGQLFMDAVADSGAVLLPIDSEHNAIFQCLPQQFGRRLDDHGIVKILLTASGGPFLRRDVATLDTVTPDEAVAHPNWVMGRKISVDSATMMNKGLEVIEAHWLFGAAANCIDVVIHPQSVIHSMVSYVDGSVLAQLGNPDMRTPIAHALAWPERIASGVAPLDLTTLANLVFQQPDLGRFPCLKLAYHALNAGGSAPAVLNAANEVAVQAFLDLRIGFRQIDQLIARVMDAASFEAVTTIDALFEQDQRARQLAHSLMTS